MEDPFPRGVVMGKQVIGPPLSEAEHYAIGFGFRCRTRKRKDQARPLGRFARSRFSVGSIPAMVQPLWPDLIFAVAYFELS
jgi:hypothetical protein